MNVLFEPVEVFQKDDYEMSIDFEYTVTDVYIIYRNADGILKQITGVHDSGNEYVFLLTNSDTETARTDVYDLIVHYKKDELNQHIKIINYLKISEL